MWKLTIEDDEGKRTPLPLVRDEYTIGRGEENTVRLTERNRNLLVGSSHVYNCRGVGVLFDRVNLHRVPLIGYQGVINMLSTICNKFIDITDETCDERHFEMMR